MKIAIEGCAHGELDKIYEAIQFVEKEQGVKIDLLICCGDFQATRNSQDLSCMAVSQKYRQMCSFYKYYSGEKEAPVLTLFIGGNHEASNHLQELGYGGWAAPNIYYLGYAGVVNIGGVRIAGLSGIYKSRDYMRGHYEIVPYSEESKRSVYHIRNLEVFRLKQLKSPIDLMLSHDWPRGVTSYGDANQLLERKPFFRQDIEDGVLGSKPAEELLHDLKPSYWFAAHLHCKFAAFIPHGPRKGATKFLALDKCLPKRKFLQILEFDHDENVPLELSYDLEWLTIIHLTNHLLSVKKGVTYMPGRSEQERWIFTPTEEEKEHVLKRFSDDLKIPLNFSRTVVPFDPDKSDCNEEQPVAQLNPQTSAFCERLGVDDPLALLLDGCSQGTTPNAKSLSGFLTPDCSRDTSQVSLTDDEASPFSSQNLSCSKISSNNSSNISNHSFARRLRMSLPPPKLVLSDESSEDLISLSIDSEELTEETKESGEQTKETEESEEQTKESVESEEQTNETNTSQDSLDTEELSFSESPGFKSKTEDTEPARPVKKFKRRNIALYANSEDE